jgi:hypothetical protein
MPVGSFGRSSAWTTPAATPWDQALVTAAASVCDLSAAEAAIGSSQGRPIISFRQLAKVNMLSRVPPGHTPLPLNDSGVYSDDFRR